MYLPIKLLYITSGGKIYIIGVLFYTVLKAILGCHLNATLSLITPSIGIG